MRTLKHITYSLSALAFAILSTVAVNGCRTSGGPTNGLSTKNEVVWHVLGDIERMNPYLSSDESANYVQTQIWETLTGNNPRTLDFIPLLAGLPEQSADHLTWTFPINQGAKWSDGQPVTGADVIFSYKAALDQRIINGAALRSNFGNLDSVFYPNGDNTKVAFHFSKFRYDIEYIINYAKILPKHIFDPNNITDKMTWSDLKTVGASNPALQEFATSFESEKIGRDPKYLIGSGPYRFLSWITNDRITLQRDTNYWGKNRPWQDAYPDKIIFKTIKDQNAALTALKAKDIDVTDALNASQYLNQFDTTTLKGLKKDTIYMNAYSFLAWNDTRPYFKSAKTRRALTMLVNRDEILHSILHDLAKKIEGPVMPTQPNFDPTVKEPAFDLEAGKKLLAEDGWADTDGDGILDKVIDGKKTPFKFTFQVNAGNESRKQILLVVANQLKKAGIDAGVSSLEWSVFLENQKSHNFDACYSAWIGNAGVEDDIYQLWHSSQSKNKGSNFCSYINPEADKLLEAIQVEPDKAKRFELSHKLQHLMVDDQPVTWMFSPPYFVGWVDRFDNVELFTGRPPYVPQYWIVRGSGVKRLPTGVPMSLDHGKTTTMAQ